MLTVHHSGKYKFILLKRCYAYATWSTQGMIDSAAARYFRANPNIIQHGKVFIGKPQKVTD